MLWKWQGNLFSNSNNFRHILLPPVSCVTLVMHLQLSQLHIHTLNIFFFDSASMISKAMEHVRAIAVILELHVNYVNQKTTLDCLVTKVSLFIYIFVCLFVCLFVCSFIHSIVHSSIYLFHCPFVHSALCPFLFLLLLLHPFFSFTIFCQTAHASMVPVIMVLMAMERVSHNPVKMVILVMIVRQL